MTCAACGAENRADARFCAECGAGLARVCPNGHPVSQTARFCDECGAQLGSQATPRPETTPPPQAERRLVSVLFADLVGFTAASEGRDAEDTRELLTRYFDTARTVIERYGGTVEKFIGDAVMAVWGARVANEDDAERAVRAALDLLDAIPALDPSLQARAGVLTGEAVVSLAAEGQGMVAGDLVNTASRIQSVADPGAVLVGDATRRATDTAIVYDDAGAHELKGKAERVPLFRARRLAAVRGAERAGGLEAPFVGRSAELRLLKDLFHASVDESRARLVSVVGVAGIGKTRLSWELEKYLDGVAAEVWWHRGRCLAYGDGVAYWALAEMVRARARITEDEDAGSATAKLGAVLELHVDDAEERAWIEPRLAHLLGLADRTAPDREDLFAAWRRFFERLAEQGPLVLVFEDLHWADEGLVSFVEYLLDWSRHHPILVVTLARPEVADRHPAFPGSTRSAVTLALEPLPDAAMDELLTGLVPDLPDDVRARLREAAGGVPLYAVETVRMLRDRGLLSGAAAKLAELDVPETLHALIASRLDALPDAERRVLQDASVLGKTFTPRGLAALSGLSEEGLAPLVDDLVRKELLAVETDPFSPDRGQLGFLQALVQRVTYETIARRDRRARHLAAARYLAEDAGIDPDEIAEVIAAHYLDAHQSEPGAEDADAVRAEARNWFTRAAERAASLAASLEAQRAFVRAADLAPDEVERGKSLSRAGQLAIMGNRLEEAESLLREAIDILSGAGASVEAAGAENALGEILFATDRLDEAIVLLEGALVAYESAGDEKAIATVSAQLGRFCLFAGRREEAMAHVERALELAERLRLAGVVVQALINKSLTLESRPNESMGLMRQALVLAEETGDWSGAIRATLNLGYLESLAGRERAALGWSERGLEIARRMGDRVWERSLASNLMSGYVDTGQWEAAIHVGAELPSEGAIPSDPVHANIPWALAIIAHRRGEDERAVELLAPIVGWRGSARVQTELAGAGARALTAIATGRCDDAIEMCLQALEDERIAVVPTYVESVLDLASEAAWDARSEEALGDIVARVEGAPGGLAPPVDKSLTLARARLAALRGEPEPPFPEAIALLRAAENPYLIAMALLDHGEWLVGLGRHDEAEPLLVESRAILEELRATPLLERLARVEATAAPVGA
jgi:class 3 adenylate cyclase/tetratricopeptide (TPR) repeat protein